MREEELDEIYNILLEQIKIQNIKNSLFETDSDKIINAYDAIHEFWTLWTYIIDSKEELLSRITFRIYHKESSIIVIQSFIQALTGHYNAANTLLRTVLELYIKGAYYDCLAHEIYRSKLPLETKKGKYTIRKIIEDRIKENPEEYTDLENITVKVLFIIDPLIYNYSNDKDYYLNNFREIIIDLTKLGLFYPMDNNKSSDEPVNQIYGIYKSLSQNVHAKHYSIDIMRRISKTNEFLEPKVIKEDLELYLHHLNTVIDIGTLTEFNILKDLIDGDRNIENKLRSRLKTLDDLNLYYTFRAIKEFVE